MTTYSLRCRNSSCRHRRISKIHPDEYKVVPKCSVCNRRCGWRIEGREYNKRGLCNCDGPVWPDGRQFPHRTSHPCCEQHPQGIYNQAKRAGVKDEEIPIEHLGRKMKQEEPCPF